MAAWGEGLKQLHLAVINSLIPDSARTIPDVSLAHYLFECGETQRIRVQECNIILRCDHSMVSAFLD